MGVNDVDGNFDRILREFQLNYPARKGQAWGLPTSEFDDVRFIYNDHSTKKGSMCYKCYISRLNISGIVKISTILSEYP